MTNNNNNNNNNNSNSGSKNQLQEMVGSYFLELARGTSKMKEENMEEDMGDEEAPTELNTINSSGGFLVVSTDKLSVKYTSVNLHGHDVGVVQASKPAPVKRLVYYFEIFVKDAGTKGQIAIGFTTDTFKMRRQPGSVFFSFHAKHKQIVIQRNLKNWLLDYFASSLVSILVFCL